MKTFVVTAALIPEDGRILVAQRRAGDSWGFRWEFPGGKLEEDESPDECLTRELREELGIQVQVKNLDQAVFKRYDTFNILLLAYVCTIKDGVPTAIGCKDVKWVGEEELKNLKMPPADEHVRAELLQKGLWALDVA